MKNQEIGRHGEAIVVSYLRAKGYQIIDQNCHMRIGEIDIVAKRDDTYHFVEVKTRLNEAYDGALSSLTARKIKHFKNAVLAYQKKYCLFDYDISLDFAAVDIEESGEIHVDWHDNISI